MRTIHRLPRHSTWSPWQGAPRSLKRFQWLLVDRLLIDPTVGAALNRHRIPLGLPPVRRVFRDWINQANVVKSGLMQCNKACPLCPRKRHQMRHMGMSALGQKRTRGLAMLQSGGFNSDVEGGEEKAQRCQKQLPQLLKGPDLGAAS